MTETIPEYTNTSYRNHAEQLEDQVTTLRLQLQNARNTIKFALFTTYVTLGALVGIIGLTIFHGGC